MGWMEQAAIVGQVALAGLLGGAIGGERESAGKAAGLRTHMFIAMAATFFVVLSKALVVWFAQTLPADSFRADPIGVIQAIVVGISFIGAGMIIFRPEQGGVEGLTTASSTLLVSAIGIAVGIGELVLATGVTVLTLVVLLGVRRIEAMIRKHAARHLHDK